MKKEDLWIAVKNKINSKNKIKLTEKNKKSFFLILEQYKRQHGHLPVISQVELEKVPGLTGKIKFLVSLGNVPGILYTPDKKSRKGNSNYFHPTKKGQKLLTDSTGKILIYKGNSSVKKDGWIHD